MPIRIIAIRQLTNLMRKRREFPHLTEFYDMEIKKLIEYEKNKRESHSRN